MNAEQKQQLQRDAAQFERLKNSVAELAALERQEQEQSRELEQQDLIDNLSAKLFNDCSNFQRLREENDKSLIDVLWNLRSIITDRIALSKRTAEIVNTSRHLAHQTLIKNGNLPPDQMGARIEIDMLSSQLIMDEIGQPTSNLMIVENQNDEVISAILNAIRRYTGDTVINKTIQKPSPFVQSQDGVHWIDIPVKDEL